MSPKDKAPRRKAQVDSRKVPRVAQGMRPADDRTARRARKFTPADPQGKVVVQLGRFDTDGPWCLSKITKADHVALLKRISSVETMTVQQVFNYGGEPGKDYEVGGLPNKQAIERLEQLEYDDETQLSRLRVSGTGRLYGFRRDERFYALWWDPDHMIWPSVKKHT